MAQEGEIVIRKMKKEILEKAFGVWKSRGSGADFVRKLRDKSDRARRLGI
ncbi:hypothetical protein HY546_02740 [archaeon]|nr:hypothetical protein [archaeon]